MYNATNIFIQDLLGRGKQLIIIIVIAPLQFIEHFNMA